MIDTRRKESKVQTYLVPEKPCTLSGFIEKFITVPLYKFGSGSNQIYLTKFFFIIIITSAADKISS